MIPFVKMHGAANDYAVVDCFSHPLPSDVEGLAREVCDRRRGIGADGLVLVLACEEPGVDAEMRMHNPDGAYAGMCGNALRCVAKLLNDEGRVGGRMTILSGERRVALRVLTAEGRESQIEADLGPPELAAERVPTTLSPDERGWVVDAPIEGQEHRVTAVSMGNPHCVLFVDSLPMERADDWVVEAGKRLERHASFPEKTNVEFVEVVDRGKLRQRTWERGAGETLACGSGACAVGVAGVLTGRTERRVEIELLGGVLGIDWREADDHVLMRGPAVEVFRGQWPG